ncbi:MAG: 4Fe-4S binding protein [Candidatus Eremiobacteraeota bacterium]|nr:4Fe-4S binding protein [Candidatus Eremiobacteraeota bacterium]
MKQISVISGKGGTGKTSLVGAFGNMARHPVLADCDVDASDLHLIVTPTTERISPKVFRAGYMVELEPDICIGCGECEPVCRFNAVKMVENPADPEKQIPYFDPLACEGCGACADVCPVEAIGLYEKEAGMLYIANTRFGPMVYAFLKAGEANSGKLVTLVREHAKKLAESEDREIVLIDGSPGIGCPVIASLAGVDSALIVTEPTVSGLHDLKRVAGVCNHFNIPAGVVINKYDLNPEISNQIESSCNELNVTFLGGIPFAPAFTEAMIERKTIIEYENNGKITSLLREIWDKVVSFAEKKENS